MPKPPETRFDHPATIATVVRTMGMVGSPPARWRSFADRIEAHGGPEPIVATIRQHADLLTGLEWRRLADRIEYEEGIGGHPWTREEIGLTAGTESTERTRAGADGAADHRQRPAGTNNTLPAVVR